MRVENTVLHCPYWTSEDGQGEVRYRLRYAGAVTLTIEGKVEQASGLNLVCCVPITTKRVCPAFLCSDLIDVAIASETVRVRVSRW